MKKLAKKITCIVLIMSILTSISICFAGAETDKTYRHYDKLVLFAYV